MAFPGDVNSLGSVSGSQTLAAAGHATRHNEVKTALEGLRDVLGGTAVPSGTVQPILAAGSASAPSLSFTGDSNTGLWSPGADTLAVSTGGTERMRIDSSGNVGIGTSSPGTALHVNVPSGTGKIRLTSGSDICEIANGASTLYITNAAAGGLSTFLGGTERLNISNAGLITGTGTSLGAWTAYTPTLGGTGWAIGNGTADGVYCQIGKIVHFRLRITFGSTSTYGAGHLYLSLPVAIKSSTYLWFNGRVYDSSLAQHYWIGGDASSSAVYLYTNASPAAAVTSTAPVTWASGDIIDLAATFESA